jgi:uncharacterized membrane protein
MSQQVVMFVQHPAIVTGALLTLVVVLLISATLYRKQTKRRRTAEEIAKAAKVFTEKGLATLQKELDKNEKMLAQRNSRPTDRK